MWQINNPVYWWALLGLAIPVVIHLYNQRRTKVKILGTLRWLSKVQAARWNFRRVHQWPLLLIRLLLITVVVLLLVEIHRTDDLRSSEKLHALILIHPAAGDTNQYRQLAASWQNDTVKVHWLATGFPAAIEATTQVNNRIWSLVVEADVRFRADSIHVIAPNRQSYFTGTPPHTSAALSWELTDIPGDSIRLLWAREGNNEPELLWFRTQADFSEHRLQKGMQSPRTVKTQVSYSIDRKNIQVKEGAYTYQVPVTSPDTLKIAALVEGKLEDEWQIFRKAVQAVAQYHQVPVKFVSEREKHINWLVKLQGGADMPGKTDSLLMFEYKPGKSSGWLEPTRFNMLMIRKELTTSQVLGGGLMEALRPYILTFKYNKALPIQADFRRVDLAGSIRQHENRTTAPLRQRIQQTAGNERIWLGLLALLILTLERIWPKKMG